MRELAFSSRVTQVVVFLCICVLYAPGSIAQDTSDGSLRGRLRERIRQRIQDRMQKTNQATSNAQRVKIGKLDVAVWKPAHAEGPVPLVIFSHGFHGSNTQTDFLMNALAEAGYLVVAPNHKDAITGGGGAFSKPEERFGDPTKWSEKTFIDRHDDIKNLIESLHKDPQWNAKIDWSKLALIGHSLGGYTALACGGAWPSWRIPNVKAILALSPYAQPFLFNDNLAKLGIPVMYQGGTRDFGITPFVKKPDGAFSKTASPAYFVEFDRAGHFFWTNFTKDTAKQNLVDHYSLAFLNKYVRDDKSANLQEKLNGVTTLEAK